MERFIAAVPALAEVLVIVATTVVLALILHWIAMRANQNFIPMRLLELRLVASASRWAASSAVASRPRP